MELASKTKQELLKEFGKNESDSGLSEVQIALLTKNIDSIQGHLQTHSGDKHSRRGLQNLVAKRRKMLDYLKSKDLNRYTRLIAKLGIRR